MLLSDNFIQDDQNLYSKYIWYRERAIDATWVSNGLLRDNLKKNLNMSW